MDKRYNKEVFKVINYLNWLVVFFLGLSIGSFLNVIIYRLPLAIKGEDISLIHPNRSFCPTCKHQLSWYDLIPVFSYAIQYAKCRYCQANIAKQYPIIELTAGILSVLIVYQWGFTLQSVYLLALAYGLLTLFVIDVMHQLLPDIITLPLLWLGLLYSISYKEAESAIIGAIVGYLFLWGIYWGFKLIRNKEGMGYGDFKLTAALGAWLGWQALDQLLLISSILSIAFVLLSKQSKHKKIAFGPFLILATVFIMITNH